MSDTVGGRKLRTPAGSLAAKLPHAATQAWGRARRFLRDLDKELTVTANLGVVRADAKVTDSRPARASPADHLERLLRTAGKFARARNSGLLITIDEAHVISRLPDLAALAAAVQVVVRRSQLPIAVILAGLPGARSRPPLPTLYPLEVTIWAGEATRP